MAQWTPPTFLLAPDQNGAIPNGIIEISTPADIMLWAHTAWPGQTGTPFAIENVSLTYEIWGTETPGNFITNQIAATGELHKIGDTFQWAEITTNKPANTYFRVQSNIKLSGWDEVLSSNRLTFHLNNVPEPAALLALGSGMAGLAGLFLRRRQ
jgi:hypothetical protein